MTLKAYDPASTMQEARAQYFAVNHFGDDGGYSDAWVDFKLGPVPFPFPNSKERVRAVRYHDMHHILTGYDTDIIGEFEISAWEIAAGCKDFVAAWVLNLGGTAAGLFTAPRRTWRAFVRGRRSRSLYGLDVDALLAEKVADVRRRMGTDEADPKAAASDVPLFAAAIAAGLVVGLSLFALLLPLVPVGLVMNVLRRRSKAAAAQA